MKLIMTGAIEIARALLFAALTLGDRSDQGWLAMALARINSTPLEPLSPKLRLQIWSLWFPIGGVL